MKNQKQAYLYTGIVIFLWSTVASAFKIALRYISVIQLLLIASFTSFCILFIIVLSEGKLKKLFVSSMFLHSFFSSLLNPFLYYIVLFSAYNLLPAQIAQPLNYTWPIMLTILSAIILKQKVSATDYIAIFISFTGVTLIASEGQFAKFHFNSMSGILLALSSAVIWAIFWIINLKDKRDEAVKLCLNFLIGTILIFILALFKNEIKTINIKGVVPAIYAGLFEMGITYLLFLKALRLSKTTVKISNLIYLSPFLSLFFIHIFVGERILISTTIGLSLIILGIIIGNTRRKIST